MKRILCVFLSIVMVIYLVPMSIFANTANGTTSLDEFSLNGVEGVYNPYAYYSETTTSSDLNIATFDVTEKSTSPNSITMSAQEDRVRYNVLILDTSGGVDFRGPDGSVIYRASTAINHVKQAANKFVSDIINANGTNYIAIVEYNAIPKTISEFSNNIPELQKKINQLSAGDRNRANMTAGLQRADLLLKNISDENAIKNVVLFSTGFANFGLYNYTGHYNYNTVGSSWYNGLNKVRLFAYANVAYDSATTIKSKATLYSIGLFQKLNDIPAEGRDVLAFFKLTARDLATSSKNFYDIQDANDLEFVFGEVADEIINKRTGIFKFQAKNTEEEDYSATYYYDDEYFSEGASKYKESLATMSLCFELSAWGSNVGGTSDYSNKSRNARDLLDQIGFKNFETNDYFTVKPSEDSMGVVVAHKDIDVGGRKYTLIALATRGGGYESEWAGNFTIGASGQHQGFQKASDEAYRFLDDYITRHKGEFQNDIKFWFAGYSRGGATVNMLSGRLNDERSIAGITFDKENLYAYCFEPPMGALKSQVQPVSNYTNIHNIVNPSDPVLKVAPQSWSFTRYGVDEPRIPSVITSSNISDFNAMMEKFKQFNTEWVRESVVRDVSGNDKHIIDTFQAKKLDPSIKVDLGHWEERTGWFGIKYWVWVPNFNVDARLIANDNKPMSVFLDELILSVATGIGGRVNYAKQLQDAARLVAAEFMGGGYESYKWDRASEIFDQKLKSHIFDIAVAFLLSGVEISEYLVMEYLYDSISEAGINLYAYGSVPNALAEALNVVVRTVVASAYLNGGSDLLTLFSGNGDLVDMNGKQINGMNLFKLFPAHYPELCLAWMQMQDSNYTPEGRALFIINSYRIVRINCPVDVNIFNSSGVLVAQIINDVPQKIEGSSIISSFSSNGEKLIYLPADEQYDIKIIATGSGKLNYSVNEFSYDTGTYAKIVNYYDIPISTGNVFNGVAPRFIGDDTTNTGEGSDVKYSLSGATGQLAPSFEATGKDARNSVYSVYAESNNTEGGTVIGGGAYSEGAFAQVVALNYEKCQFIGWYDNDTLLTTDKIYRFRVDKDVTLSARFEGTRPHPLTSGTYKLDIVAGSGGSIVIGASGFYSDDSIARLETTPNSGYRFKNWTSSNGGTFDDANSASTKFTMPANATTITANFEPLETSSFITVTATAGAGGTVTGGGSYASGTNVTLTATPDRYYTFDGWYEGGTRVNGAGTTYTFVANENRTLEARFTYLGGASSSGGTSSGDGGTSSSGGASSGDGGTSSSEGTSSGSDSYTPPVETVSWSNIQTQINNAKDGDTITVDMKNETALPVSIINALKGKNVTLVLNMNSYSWTINGKGVVGDIPASQISYDLKITKITDSNLSKLVDNKDIVILELTYKGTFPFAATLKWNVGTSQAGKLTYMSYYNESTKKLEYIDESTVDNSGNVKYVVPYASKYVITTEYSITKQKANSDFTSLKGVYVTHNPNTGTTEGLNTIVPYLIENGKEALIKWSAVIGNVVAFRKTKDGSYEYRDNKKDFNDTSDHWGADTISFIAARELFNGIGNGKFDPNGEMTRAMFVKVLANIEDADLSIYNTSKFTDVDINEWYGAPVAWASENHIVNGVGDNQFASSRAITREEMAVMLSNYMNWKGIKLPENGNATSFNDNDKVSVWAQNAVANMKRMGIIAGVGANNYAPKDTANRASVAQIFKNLITVFVGKE